MHESPRGLGARGPGTRLARAVLCAGAASLLAVPGTRASWTDAASVDGPSFSTGTVDLEVESSDSVSGYSALNLSAMEPGDSTAGVLTVTNSGTAPVGYYVDATTTGIASTLTATVTTASSVNGSAPSATCAGTAVAGSGTFTSGLVSSSTPLTLVGGASQKLCIQAKLPDGAAAVGGSGTIDLTFRAITGSSASPGWTDSVPVSGTTIGGATAFYLGGNTGSPRSSTSVLPLRQTGPTLANLVNYDTDRDVTDGLLLTRGNGQQDGPPQAWDYPVPSTSTSGLVLGGTASLRIWSAMKGFSTTAAGALKVSLLDCTTSTSCTTLVSQTLSASPWSTSGGWSRQIIPITTTPSSYTWAAGHSLQIRVSTASGAADDMMVAYDTTTYESAVLIQP